MTSKTLLQQVLTYAAETRADTNKLKQLLQTVEMIHSGQLNTKQKGPKRKKKVKLGKNAKYRT